MLDIFTFDTLSQVPDMKFRLLLFFSLLTPSTIVHAQTTPAFQTPTRGFVSLEPAPHWSHALLTGNGTMGALVMGQPHEETLIFSQADLYIPLNEPKPPINQASRLTEIRKLLLEGNGEAAAKIPVDQRNKEGFNIGRDPFIPAFDMKLSQTAAKISRTSGA
jgi:alpha-L-fucosidase 2